MLYCNGNSSPGPPAIFLVQFANTHRIDRSSNHSGAKLGLICIPRQTLGAHVSCCSSMTSARGRLPGGNFPDRCHPSTDLEKERSKELTSRRKTGREWVLSLLQVLPLPQIISPFMTAQRRRLRSRTSHSKGSFDSSLYFPGLFKRNTAFCYKYASVERIVKHNERVAGWMACPRPGYLRVSSDGTCR